MEELVTRLQISQPTIVKAEVIPNTELIRVTVKNANPKLATLAANVHWPISLLWKAIDCGGGKTSQDVLEDNFPRRKPM